jgi:bifunctional DNA-binding transcriptional regulator/antitoxin component of YhaV-PrlF toxin-antitoxin module
MKLTKVAVREAMGLIPTDMVFYKDEEDKIYRLRYLKSAIYETSDQIEILSRLVLISKYAPDTLEGEIVEDSSKEVHIQTDRGIYIFQKNAENIKFWDITNNEICDWRGCRG